MSSWQVTATTIHCEWVGEDVTVMIYKNGSAKCTGQSKFFETIAKGKSKLVEGKGNKVDLKLKCIYPSICGLTNYKDKILAEEVKQN